MPLDNDGDMWENEDVVNGIDDDGDGAVDEDPEDYQPLRGASEGWIRLYYVDELQKLAEWAIPSLLYVEHNANDGLLTSAEGLQHSVLVKVPVALMDDVYRCPDTPIKQPHYYCMNPLLSEKNLDKLPSPADTILLFECDVNGKPVARHHFMEFEHLCGVAFADGCVKRMRPEEIPQWMWTPEAGNRGDE